MTNNGAEAVDFDGLTDDRFGDISGDLSEDEAGTIPVTLPVAIAAGGSSTCYYRATISGEAGTSHVNTATATANDGEGGTDSASDDATVDFSDVLPDISVTKTADVASVPETGGDVTYTFVVTNNGAEQGHPHHWWMTSSVTYPPSAACPRPSPQARTYTCQSPAPDRGAMPGHPT